MVKSNGRKAIFLAVAIAVVSSAMVFAACSSGEGADSSDTTAAMVAPEFSGVTLEGQQVALSDYLGKPVVVVFMASWCGPCRDEAPELEQFYNDNSDRAGLLAVNVSDSEEDIRAFMSENGLSFPLMLDGDSAADAYGVTAIPTTVVVDAEGHIAKRLIGGTTADNLSLVIDGLTR